MAIKVAEAWHGATSNDGRELRRDIPLIITGVAVGGDITDATNSVMNAVYGFVEDYYNDGNGILIPLVGVDSATDQGGGVWTAAAHYSTSNFTTFTAPQVGDYEIGFDIGSTTTKIYQSIKDLAKYENNSDTIRPPSPDFGGSINVTGDANGMKVGGTDVETTTFEFTVTAYMASSSVTMAWAKSMAQLVNTVNKNTFFGFEAKCVRFRGMSGQTRIRASVTAVPFKFSYSVPIPAGYQIAPGKPFSIELSKGKNGWEYLWVYYLEQLSPDETTMMMIPQRAYVEQVYNVTDFAALGIGTSNLYITTS